MILKTDPILLRLDSISFFLDKYQYSKNDCPYQTICQSIRFYFHSLFGVTLVRENVLFKLSKERSLDFLV